MQEILSRKHTIGMLTAAAVGGMALAEAPPTVAAQPPTATETRANPRCPDSGLLAICLWRVVRVSPKAGVDRHAWRPCVKVDRSPAVQHVECSIAKSTSDTVTATIGGWDPVGAATLSASVGYNVTKTTTVTTSDTVDVRRHRSGEVEWAPQFDDLKVVTQEYERCIESHPPAPKNRCRPIAHAGPRYFAHAITERYEEPVFRFHRG